MSSVGKKALVFDENFIVTPHQVTSRKKILFPGLLSVFVSLFFVFAVWFIGMTHSNPEKCTNQVILSNEHLNYLFWA